MPSYFVLERVTASQGGFANEALHDGPSIEALLLFSSSSDVEQMAIDWLTGNFYFLDDVDDRVFVCNKNGQTCVTLLDQELYNPKGIALDPIVG